MADKLLVSSVHSTGRTVLAFSRDGTYTYTGGTDSLVRVWKSDSGTDQEPDAALDAENSITTLCADVRRKHPDFYLTALTFLFRAMDGSLAAKTRTSEDT